MPPQSPLGGNPAQKLPHEAPQPDVPAADAEAHPGKGPKRRQQEQAVGQERMLRAQGPEEAVQQSQHRSGQDALPQVDQGGGRNRHPSMRRSQPPPCRGSW